MLYNIKLKLVVIRHPSGASVLSFPRDGFVHETSYALPNVVNLSGGPISRPNH
jgi:hypothetical protein